MKKSLVLFLFLIVFISSIFVFPKIAQATASFTGCYGRGYSISSTLTVTLNQTPVSGNVLIAVISNYGAGDNFRDVSSISETGVSWNSTPQIKLQFVVNEYGTIEVWFGVVGTGASTTVSITISSSSNYGFIANILEFSGVVTTSYLDKTTTHHASGTSATTGTTATTDTATELFIGGIASWNLYTHSSPLNGFILLDGQTWTGGYTTESFLFKFVSSTGTASSGVTISTTQEYVGVMTTFRCVSTTSLNENGSITLTQTINNRNSFSVLERGTAIETLTISKKESFTFSPKGLINIALGVFKLKAVSFSLYGLISESISSFLTRQNLFSRSGTIQEVLSISNLLTFPHILNLFGRITVNFVERALAFLGFPASEFTFSINGSFIILILLLIGCMILSVFRIPIIGFIFSIFTIALSALAIKDTTLPLYPMFNLFVVVVGAICLYLNAQRFQELKPKGRKR